MNPGSIVVPTNEISLDPETAIEVARGWGVRHFELKSLWEGRRVPNITDKQREQLKQLADDYGVDWVMISPGLFIREATAEYAKSELDDKLPRSIEIANYLGIKKMIVFSFRKTAGVGEEWVVDKLSRAADAAAAAGITVAIEPLIDNYGDSGRALRGLIRAAGKDNLRVNWDPGNVNNAGHESYPHEYEHVRDLVAYVHLKNHSARLGRYTIFDQGDIDLRAQLADLKRDGYDGYLSIETHIRTAAGGPPPFASTKEDYDVLVGWLSELT